MPKISRFLSLGIADYSLRLRIPASERFLGSLPQRVKPFFDTLQDAAIRRIPIGTFKDCIRPRVRQTGAPVFVSVRFAKTAYCAGRSMR